MTAGTYEGRAEVAGTVANALTHHYKSISMQDAETLAQSVISASGASENLRNTLWSALEEITDELEDRPPHGRA